MDKSKIKNISSNNFEGYDNDDLKEINTPVIGGKNNNKNLKDSLDLPNQGNEHLNSFSPEEKLISIKIISTDQQLKMLIN